jgi:cysteine desulfurase
MLPYLKERYGNPASLTHAAGAAVERDVGLARRQVAELIGAQPEEIIFTSGATESNNLALIGAARKYRDKGNHLISSRSEHHAVLDTCGYLEQCGFEVTYLPVDRLGMMDLDELVCTIRNDTILISLMAANNETGVLHPISDIGQIARERNVLFHTDATQAVGKIPIDIKAMNIDLLSMTGHKMYGPKGSGALFLSSQNPRVSLEPLLHGGGQERGLRSGTLNVPGIVGLAEACRICGENMKMERQLWSVLASTFYDILKENLNGVTLNGHPDQRLTHVMNLAFDGIDSETLMLALPDLAIASGSACTTTEITPSHVLKAMDLSEQQAKSSLRFSLGRFNTQEEIETAAKMVVKAVEKLR